MFDKMEEEKINDIDKWPKISIIIPCFNYDHFLLQTLNSLLNQSYQSWECIIIDDGSTDNTRAVVSKFLQKDARFKYFYQNNQGLSAARNAGIASCAGEYIQFLDADDLLENDKLKIQYEFLQNNPSIDVVYGQVKYFDNIDSESIHIKGEFTVSGFSGKGKELIEELVYRNITAVHAPLSKKNIFTKGNKFDVNLTSLEDWDFWWRCSLHGVSFHYLSLEGSAALYRVHTRNMSKDKWKMHYAELELREQMAKYLREPKLVEVNLSSLKRIRQSLKRYAWNDSIQGEPMQGSNKFETLFRHSKQVKYLVYSKLVKYLPTRFILVYYLISSGSIISVIDNKLKEAKLYFTNG